MRTALAVAIGLIAGLVTGIVLSEIIGIIGVVVLSRAVGVKYLPIYLAVAFAVAAPVVHARIRRGSRRG